MKELFFSSVFPEEIPYLGMTRHTVWNLFNIDIVKSHTESDFREHCIEIKSGLRLESSVFLKKFRHFFFFFFLIFFFLLKRPFQGVFSCFEILIGSA